MLDIDLFENIENEKILELLKCTGIKTKTYKKGAYILKTGSKIDFLGVILDGNAQITKNNYPDKENIIESLKVNDILSFYKKQKRGITPLCPRPLLYRR